MKNHTLKLKDSRNILFAALFVLLGIAITIAIYTVQSKNATTVTRTVELSTLHPTYASVGEMTAAPDAAFVGRAVVLDDGTVQSKTAPGDPADAPPDVHTDYKLDVKSVIKGKDIPSRVVISVMGGAVDNTRYVYEGIPRLKKGDTVIVFASLGDDGKYYPLAGSTAIAVQKDDGKFNLSKDTINTGNVTFAEQDITR